MATKFGLVARLIAMAKADQEMRERAIKDMSPWDESIDKGNTEALKEIIDSHGWPTISMVGKEASNAAWLLVQHADHDPTFQQYCLNLMKNLPSDEVRAVDLAYLEDRVRVAQGRPQLYGTQFDNPGKNFGPKHVENRANLDKRRKAVGLEPFEEYRKKLQYFLVCSNKIGGVVGG